MCLLQKSGSQTQPWWQLGWLGKPHFKAGTKLQLMQPQSGSRSKGPQLDGWHLIPTAKRGRGLCLWLKNSSSIVLDIDNLSKESPSGYPSRQVRENSSIQTPTGSPSCSLRRPIGCYRSTLWEIHFFKCHLQTQVPSHQSPIINCLVPKKVYANFHNFQIQLQVLFNNSWQITEFLSYMH